MINEQAIDTLIFLIAAPPVCALSVIAVILLTRVVLRVYRGINK